MVNLGVKETLKTLIVGKLNNKYLRGCFQNHGNAGFTLLELIVVCALIGIMLSLSIPSFRETIVSDSLKVTVRKSIGLVREVRDRAARNQEAYLLHINHIDNSIWFEPDTPELDTDTKEVRPEKWDLPEDIQISELWVAGRKKSSLEDTIIWVSPEGYLENTFVSFTDEDGRSLVVEFQTFLDDAILHDQVPSL